MAPGPTAPKESPGGKKIGGLVAPQPAKRGVFGSATAHARGANAKLGKSQRQTRNRRAFGRKDATNMPDALLVVKIVIRPGASSGNFPGVFTRLHREAR
jgi:hypothetical protein